MKTLIDTNVIIDILEQREPFFADSYKVIQLSLEGKIEAFMSAGAVTDVYYIISRSLHDHKKARDKIMGLTTLIRICDTFAVDISSALPMNITDFEDAVVASVAKREKADYIITRNEADFANSPVPTISSAQFLKQVTDYEQ
jgi:predicted nucleic acid-binding protein